jgi:SAM-dependent methyltransferase
MTRMTSEAATQRLLGLLDPPPGQADLSAGYLDLIGGEPRQPTGIAEGLMRTPFVPAIYERWWRPALGRMFKGPGGPDIRAERELAREWLGVSPGDTVLDLACGPGNFTRDLACVAGPNGLVIGVDASATMLGRAVQDTAGVRPRSAPIAYARADATKLPLRQHSFDAVCCFAALHLMREPFRVLDWMTEVLRPGGRIAIMTSCRRGAEWPGVAVAARLISRVSGMGLFGPDEITGALAARGYTGIRQRIAGVVQFAGGRLPSAAA